MQGLPAIPVTDLPKKPLGSGFLGIDKFFKSYSLKAKLLLPAWVIISENFSSKWVI
jgi:hypothetical protein